VIHLPDATYMLNTDTVSFAVRGQGRGAARLLKHRPSQLCIGSIALAGLHLGAEARDLESFTA
jgi:predicted nucleic acid-binding protein